MARPRACSCAAPKATNGPICPTTALARSAADWLAPLLARQDRAAARFRPTNLSDALDALLPWNLRTPARRRGADAFHRAVRLAVPIDYEAEEGPKLSIRVQELFGLDRHPAIAGGRVPLVIELLSPAHRPVQVTRDLPGFWRGSYAAVKAEMRGRYPRHPWPDDPLTAPATRRAKPRGE